MTAPLTEKKHLAFLRLGDASTHREWIGDPATRSYDVWLDYYGEKSSAQWAADPAHLTDGPNTTKFARIAALLPELARYEAIWFPDDDIRVDPAGVEALFRTFRKHDLLLAQPALADGSYVAHEITWVNGSFEVRFTNFVEAMCPLFSREALRICAPAFSEVASAYGLDMVWSTMLGDPRDRIAMIDAAPVIHSRPIGTGPWKSTAGRDPGADKKRVVERYGLSLPFPFRTYGGVPRGKDGTLPAGVRFLAEMVSGAPPSVRLKRRYWSRTLKSVWRGR